jgi:hypothetical protein
MKSRKNPDSDINFWFKKRALKKADQNGQPLSPICDRIKDPHNN